MMNRMPRMESETELQAALRQASPDTAQGGDGGQFQQMFAKQPGVAAPVVDQASLTPAPVEQPMPDLQRMYRSLYARQYGQR